MYWPLIPSFATERKLPYSTANTGWERLRTSNTYRRLLNSRRCLIPTDGFYEWQGKIPPKKPWFVYLKTKEPFALAGLWDTWKVPDGSVLESFTIITTEPNDFMRPIHDRMPVILRKEDEAAWLDCSAKPFDKVESLLTQFPAKLMAAHEVSTKINNSNYDAPDCSAPVEGERR
jgi:putative SOS response-associated peptidase YedK